MSFLTPLFLLGGLAIALPVLFHLIRRTSKEKIPFSSLMFLTPSPPRVTKRSRPEHLLLLLLRCLVLLLLALGFARPFLPDAGREDREAGAGTRALVLLDTSASMRREGVWAEARKRVDKVLADAGPADLVAVHSFDRETRPLMTFAQWKSLPPGERRAVAETALKPVQPGWAATRLGHALARATALLEESGENEKTDQPARVVLVTDLQAGSQLEELQTLDWPAQVRLQIESIAVPRPANAGLQILPAAANESLSDQRAAQKVRVFNAADSGVEQFKVGWARSGAGADGAMSEIYVPPGQSRVVSLEIPGGGEARTEVLLVGDREAFDNRAWLIPPKAIVTRVLYLGSEEAKDTRQPRYFLERAFPPTVRNRVQITAQPPGDALFLAPNPFGLIVVTGPLTPASGAPLRAALEAGATVLCAPGNAAALQSFCQLLGWPFASVTEAATTDYRLLGQIDFQHPLFAPFADPRFSDFTKIHFWRHRAFSAADVPGAKVVARFDNDDPAIVEAGFGRGTVYLLTSGWHPVDSQLALSSKFVPLLNWLIELSGALTRQATLPLVGDELPNPFARHAGPDAATNGTVILTAPDGRTTTLAADAKALPPVDQPGVWTVTRGTNVVSLAVNLDPRESRTEPLPSEQLERHGIVLRNVTLETALQARERQLKSSEIENRQKLWRWLIVTALVLLSLEMLIAGRLSRPATEPAPTA